MWKISVNLLVSAGVLLLLSACKKETTPPPTVSPEVALRTELDSSSKALIACYLDHPVDDARHMYRHWYAEGKKDREAFFARYPYDPQQQDVLREFESHTAWKQHTALNLTPTVLVNGYKLPDNYKIEDLAYFTDLVFDAR